MSTQTTTAFNARALRSFMKPERLYRVYFAPGGLFFIRIGGERHDMALRHFGIIGLLISYSLQKKKKARAQEAAAELDQRSLKDRLEDHKLNFRVPFGEIHEATINPPVFFGGTGKHAGRVTMKFENHGKIVFEIEDPQDMHVAIRELSQVLADRVDVRAQGNKDKKKFVKKRKA